MLTEWSFILVMVSVLLPAAITDHVLYRSPRKLRPGKQSWDDSMAGSTLSVIHDISLPRHVPQNVHDSVSNVSHLPAVNYRIQSRIKKYKSTREEQ